MVTKLAYVDFHDETRWYGTFSTVTDTFSHEWFTDPECVGEPRLCRTDQPACAPDELVTTVVVVEPDYRWTTLFCPSHQILVGPICAYTDRWVQQEFELHPAKQGKEHLSRPGAATALCGYAPLGREIPFLQLPDWGGSGSDNPPDRRLFDEWDDGVVCRECLTQPEILRHW